MARTATNANGDVVIFNDSTQSWDPARTAANEKGDKVYFDGSAWQPVGGAAAGGNARPAAAAPRSSPSQPAAAPTAPAAASPSYTPLADQAFGPRPDPALSPGNPVATSLYNIARQAPYDIESSLHSSVDMFEHGRKALFEEGKPSGAVGMGAGFGSLFGAPSAPVFNALSQPLDKYATVPFEKMTGMPHEISDAAIFASPLLGMKGGHVPTARPLKGDVLTGDRGPPPGGRTPPPDIEGETINWPVSHPRMLKEDSFPSPANQPLLPAPHGPEGLDFPGRATERDAFTANEDTPDAWQGAPEVQGFVRPTKPANESGRLTVVPDHPSAEAIDRSLKPMRDVLGLSDDKNSKWQKGWDEFQNRQDATESVSPSGHEIGYHGTRAQFDTFEGAPADVYAASTHPTDFTPQHITNPVTFFTSDKDHALGFAENAEGSARPSSGKPRIAERKIPTKNLLTVDLHGDHYATHQGDAFAKALRQGRDGVRFINAVDTPSGAGRKSTIYAIFNHDIINSGQGGVPPEGPTQFNSGLDPKSLRAMIDRSLKPMRDVLGLDGDKGPRTPPVNDNRPGLTPEDVDAVIAQHQDVVRVMRDDLARAKAENNPWDIKYFTAKIRSYENGIDSLRRTGELPDDDPFGGPTQFNSGLDPKSLRAVIDPTGMDANSRQAESMIRDEIGMANRDTAITADLLEEHQRRVNMMTPVEKYDLFRYIQNRSSGFPINDPTLQGLADTMRDAFKERETKLRNLPSTAQMGFYEDYLPQLVKDPKTFAGGGLGVKQGSGAFTKERFYETIDDLIAAGHELKTDNPIELTMDYVTNADRYIALNAVRDTAEAAGDIAYITDRRRVPDGWDKLQGRLGVKHTPGGQVQGYAPEGFARVFNNFVSRGATGDWKNIYDMAARTSNAIQALEFAASQYHAFTVAMKAPVVEIGRAFQAVRRGAPLTAGKALMEAPMASITTALKGRKAQQIYLRRPGVNASAADREVVNILTRANHRFKGLDPSKEYEYSAMRDYWRSWKRGALKTELLNDWANVKADPLTGPPKMIMRHVGRIIQTIAKPVFEHYIPQLKNGAAFGAMKQWLELHPGANAADKLKAARDIVDQVDNMMGEMVHDNIFWQRAQKQVAQLAMTSFSWTFGNARWVAGAAADAPKAFMPRGDLSLRTATLLAYPIVLGTLSAMLQYLMTGKPPDDVTDLIAPKTGGKVQSGRAMVDERLMIPGSHKDWLGWYFDPGQEFKNKLSRGLHIGADLASGADYRDDPLSVAKPYSPQWFMDYFKYAAEEMLPIAAQQTGQGKAGSHISDMARFIGFKEAPMYLQNPKGWEAWQASQANKATKTKIRHDKESERRYKGPVE